jgi:DNA mismatch repair ATPase MutS
LKNRNAIRILQINGYPTEIVKEAVEISNELDKMTLSNQHTKEPSGISGVKTS